MNLTGNIRQQHRPEKSSRMGWLKLTFIIGAAAIIATVASVWVTRQYLFPDAFSPVTLTAKEEQVLNAKIDRMEHFVNSRQPSALPEKDPAAPERYTEDPAMRTIVLSEKELNALIAKDTELAEKLVIDLSDGMASAKLLLPLDADFPILGGKILKVAAGLGIDYSDGKPVVILKGVSLWGVPVPNAWLGNMKNVDLVKEFGAEKGFWKSFAEGIDKIEIREESLQIRLRE